MQSKCGLFRAVFHGLVTSRPRVAFLVLRLCRINNLGNYRQTTQPTDTTIDFDNEQLTIWKYLYSLEHQVNSF